MTISPAVIGLQLELKAANERIAELELKVRDYEFPMREGNWVKIRQEVWSERSERIAELETSLKMLGNERYTDVNGLNDRIAELEKKLAEANALAVTQMNRRIEAEMDSGKLRELAQAVVESDADARRQQVTHWKNPVIDVLAKHLEETK